MDAIPDEALANVFVGTEDPKFLAIYASVSHRFRKLANSDEVWHRICANRWSVIPDEKDIHRNTFLPRHKEISSLIVLDSGTEFAAGEAEKAMELRLHWRSYYWLRLAAEAELNALIKIQEEFGIEPVGMAPPATQEGFGFRFGARKKKGAIKPSVPLSDATFTPQNLFDMCIVAENALQTVAEEEDNGDNISPHLTKQHEALLTQFMLELLSHATNPITISAATSTELRKWGPRVVDLAEMVGGLEPNKSSADQFRRTIHLCMHVISNCVGEMDYVEVNAKFPDSGLVASHVLQFIYDLSGALAPRVVSKGSFLPTIETLVSYCADLIRISVTEDNWIAYDDGADMSLPDVKAKDDNSDDNVSEQLHDLSAGILDNISAKMVESQAMLRIMDKVLRELQQADIEDDWRGLYACLTVMCSSAEGCAGDMTSGAANSWFGLCIGATNHSHPAVRWQATNALGQLANDLSAFAIARLETLLPAIFVAMTDSHHRVRGCAYQAAMHVIDGSPPDILKPFMPMILSHVLSIFENIPTDPTAAHAYINENGHFFQLALRNIATVVGRSGPDVAEICLRVLPILRRLCESPPVLRNASANAKFAQRLIECYTMVFVNVPQSVWIKEAPLLGEKMKLLGSLTPVSGPADVRLPRTNNALRESWARLCQALGPLFQPYLEDCIATEVDILRADIAGLFGGFGGGGGGGVPFGALVGGFGVADANANDEAEEEDEEGSDDGEAEDGNDNNGGGVDGGDGALNANVLALTDSLVQRESALVYLRSYAEHAGIAAFRPFLPALAPLAMQELQADLSETLRINAAALLPALLKNVIDLPADWFNFADHIVDRLVAQCRIELDPSVFSAMFDSLSEIIEAALAEWPSLNNIKFVEQICESAYSKLRALQEQQMDESWQSISESSDYTMAIMNTLSMLTNKSNLARRVQFEKPQIWFEFLTTFEPEFGGLVQWHEPVPRVLPYAALCFIDDMLSNNASIETLKDLPVHLYLQFAESRSPMMSQTALFGLGLIAERYPTLLKSLDDAVAVLINAARRTDLSFLVANENAISSLGRVIVAHGVEHAQSLWYETACKLYWEEIPLLGDEEESKETPKQLIALFERGERFLVDECKNAHANFSDKVTAITEQLDGDLRLRFTDAALSFVSINK